MRISDWSSDVCSSDLLGDEALAEDAEFAAARRYAPSATLATLGHAKARFGPFAVIDGATVRMAGDVTAATPRQFAAIDRKSTRLNSSPSCASRMPSSACNK